MRREWHLTLLLICLQFSADMGTFVGPSFFNEPPSRVEFANDTGARIDCTAEGSPVPLISWVGDNGKPVVSIPQTLDILSNGSLLFLPFHPSGYRHDIHATTYRCLASNDVGKIVSRDIRVRAVVLQYYEIQAQFSKTVLRGNTAFLKCNIPSFVREYITITSWLQDSSFNIYPSLKGDGKYHMLPTGELLVRRVDDADKYRSYQCRAMNRLNAKTLLSLGRARLSVTDPRQPSAPRHIEGPKTYQVNKNQPIVLPCFAEGNPPPTFQWFRQERQQLHPIVEDERIFQFGECLIVLHAGESDAGLFVCIANNTVGSERLSITLQVKSPLTVTIQPSGQFKADIGSRAEIYCFVSGGTLGAATSRTWLKDSHVVGPATNSEKLVIPRVQREDAGMYQCIVQGEDDNVQSSVQLVLGVAHPQLLYKFIHQTLQPGPPVSLKCIAMGNPTPRITWKLDGFPLPQNERFVIGQYVTLHGDVISHVNISNVQVEDGGIYQCTASNKVGEAVHSADMRVYGLPFIRAIPNISATAGEPLYIACPVAGYPIDSITWEKDGRKLPLNRRQMVFPNGTLVLENVQRDPDKGNYRCIAENKQGRSESQNLALNVIVPPRIAPFSFLMDLHEGDRAGVQCFITKGDLPLNIEWTKDGMPLESGISVRQLGEFTSSLSIESLAPHHAGVYTCQATNQAAKAILSSTLLVNVPPRWIAEPHNLNVTRGSVAKFDCQTDGFPTPSLVWRRLTGQQPNEYQEASRTRGVQIFPNGTLLIRQAFPEHQDQYLCEATNGIGAGLSSTVSLIVYRPPEFEVQSAQVSVRRSASQNLECQVLGDRPISIIWQRDGSQSPIQFNPRYTIKESTVKGGFLSQLFISSTIKTDSGTYSCIASNAFGQAERTVHLQVQDAPGKPHDLRILDTSSRSVKLSWLAPLDDRSPVLQYVVQYKLDSNYSNDWQSTSASTEQTTLIRDLLPGSVYLIRVLAENELGAGEPSDHILFRTEGEAPTGEPQNLKIVSLASNQLKVTWEAPLRELWNGEILGYYVGYRDHGAGRLGGFNYSTMPPNSNGFGQVILSGLRKYRNYGVVVQAFNEKGPGPLTTEVVAQTLEDVPSAPPLDIICMAQSSQSLVIRWQPPPQLFQNGQLLGYKVHYENMEEWPPGYIEAETKMTTEVSTELHSLQKYSNYSLQVWAFTQVGDGVKSRPIYCMTAEDVPDAPAGLKVMLSSPNSLIVSWAVPIRTNGQLTSYTVYSRILKAGQERDTSKKKLSPLESHYQATNLQKGEAYEFWITAFTRIGEGQSTQVVYATISNRVPPAIISFGRTISVRRGSSVKLPCLSVGIPPPKYSWIDSEGSSPIGDNFSIKSDGSLEITDIQRHHQNNYTCIVSNTNGSDQITSVLLVLVPPSAPVLGISSTGLSWLHLQWKMVDNGGSAVRGFILNYHQDDSAEWEERSVSRDLTSYQLTALACGVEYHLQMMAYNSVGIGAPSPVLVEKTDGNKPGRPSHTEFIEVNTTFLTLHLKSWNDHGCPILSYSIEYKEGIQEEWITVVNNVQARDSFVVLGLWPATQYIVKVKAINSAGFTTAEYRTSTLSILGATVSPDSVKVISDDQIPLYFEAGVLVPVTVFIMALIFLIAAITICLRKKHERENMGAPKSEVQSMVSLDNKQNLVQREQYYAAIHKGFATPERIPEYADDISPYATFHVAGSERPTSSPAHIQSFVYHDHHLTAMETMQLKSGNLRDDFTKLKRNTKNRKCFNPNTEHLGSNADQWSEQNLTISLADRIPLQSILYSSSAGGLESSTSPEASPVSDRRTPRFKVHVR